MNFKKINDLVGWVLFGIATLVYTLTVEPTASFWDCGEFIAVSYKLMVPHPPGAPLFLLIGNLFSNLAMGNVEKVAFWINMVSVLSSAFTILFMYWSIVFIAKKIVKPTLQTEKGLDYTQGEQLSLLITGAIGALSYTFSDSFWFSAVEAEVYGMSSFFTAFVVWAMLKWETIKDASDENKWMIFIAYIIGLSIGVHLLNLVTVPALGYIYYNKKYAKQDFQGFVITMLVSLVIVGIIMVGVIPGLPSIAGKFEIMFKNGFGLPFGAGALMFTILFLGALVYGIQYSIKKQNVLLNTILLGCAFILIGYSSYAIILIRSNFNPPIDENDPQDVMSFVSYLKREQYGDRPLLYGRTFMSERDGVEKGEAMYRKGKDAYEIYDYRTEVIYKDNVLLPRMYSQGDDHPDLYRSWANMRENEKPTLANNLYYMFKYQIGHMYFRYFLWNFAGRDGDEKEAAWLSPFESNEGLPPIIANNKARDNYYMLPLILGLIGLFYQLKKDEKGFIIIGLLFVLTGVAIVVYLNSPPVEPRERDYIYVGSYYAFAMWIGFGALAIMEFLQKTIKNETLRPVAAGLLSLTVPMLMGFKGWDNHNRSGRYHSIDQAKNTLRSCAKNAVLFTGGDNDTFPLWYVQDVEGFRTDVRVLVLSYYATDWYIEQTRRQAYESAPLPYSLTFDNYKSGVNDFLPYVENPNVKGGIDLKKYLELVKQNHEALLVELQGGSFTASIPTRTLYLPINKKEIIAKNIVPKEKQNRIVDTLVIKMKQSSSALYKSDLMILDLIASSNWDRPIYFNNTSSRSMALEIRDYLQMEGMAYRLLPMKAETLGGELGEVDAAIMDKNMQSFQFRGFESADNYHDEEYRKFGANERECYYRLGMQLFLDGNKKRAEQVLDSALIKIPDYSIPYDYDYHLPKYVELYHLLGKDDKAKALAKTLLDRSETNLKFVTTKGNGIQYSSLKDYSMMIMQQLMLGYRRAADREQGIIASLERRLEKASRPELDIKIAEEDVAMPTEEDSTATSANTEVEKLKKRIERANKRQEFYKTEFEKFETIFRGYYDKFYKE
jgi:hypothetical protein